MKLIWTWRALDRWVNGRSDPAHTISSPNIGEVYQGFVQQFRRGTVWALIDADGSIVDTGTAGSPEALA